MSTAEPTGVSRAWRIVALGLLAGLAAHVALSFRRPAVTDAAVVTVRDLSSAAADDARMDRVLDAVDFDHAKLADIFRSLADRVSINVVPDWDGLAAANVRPDSPITLHLKTAHWSSAMDAALLLADPQRKAVWRHRGDVVAVTLGEVPFTGPFVARVYDVAPLIEQWTQQRRRIGITPAPAIATGGFGGDQSQQSSTQAEAEAGLDDIRVFIENNVDPSSWKDNGGEYGSISAWGTDLIVHQTDANQRQTAAALQLLVHPK